jgi:hypothetical protein
LALTDRKLGHWASLLLEARRLAASADYGQRQRLA